MKTSTSSMTDLTAYVMPKLNWHTMDLQEMASNMSQYVPANLGLTTMLMPTGIIHSIYTEDGHVEYQAITTTLQSAWFEMDNKRARKDMALIAIWHPTFAPWADITIRNRALNHVRGILEQMGYYVALTRLNGQDVQLYCTVSKNWANDWINDWGIEVDDMEPGKLLKRLGILSISQGACAWRDNVHPYMVGGNSLRIAYHNNIPSADGALRMSKECAMRLCGLSGIPWTSEYTRMQIWIASRPGLIKGMANIDRTHDQAMGGWNNGGWDLIVPTESTDPKFRVMNGTICKIVPHAVARSASTLKPFDGLLRMPETVKHISAEEIYEVQNRELINMDNQDVDMVTELSHVPLLAMFEENGAEPLEQGDRYIQNMIRTSKQRLYQDEALELFDMAQASAFVTPEIMRQVTGQTERRVNARHERWMQDCPDGQPRMLPGAYVSAVRGYWTYGPFVGCAELRRNEVAIIWNKNDPDGFVFNSVDDVSEQVRYRSDGGDKDDLLDGIMVKHSHTNTTFMWVVRNPTSWGGGWFTQMRPQDVEWLTKLGYHTYTLTNLHEIRDLPTLAKTNGLHITPNTNTGV